MRKNRAKKGFALVSTVVAMAVVLALSALLFAILSNQKVQANAAAKNFENRLEISELSANFASMAALRFEQFCSQKGYSKTQNAEVVIFEKSPLKVAVETVATGTKMQIVNTAKRKIVAQVEKNGGEIKKWSYLEEDL